MRRIQIVDVGALHPVRKARVKESAVRNERVEESALPRQLRKAQPFSGPWYQSSNPFSSPDQSCNRIIEDILSALEGEKSWAHKSPKPAVCLREFAFRLEHWKNSIRWCATGGRSTGCLIDDEIQARRLFRSLEKDNNALS
jgi:hypothetical protein